MPEQVLSASQRLVNVFGYYAGVKGQHERPWKLGPWLWATQGHFIVAVLDDGAESDPTPENRLNGERYLIEIPEDLALVSLEKLTAFAGVVQAKDVPCCGCDGDGYYDEDECELIKCEHCGKDTRTECPACDGDGKAGLETRHGNVAGVHINLCLLAYALSLVTPCDLVKIGTLPSPKQPEYMILLVVGNGWRVVVMSMSTSSVDVPQFKP